MAIQTIVINDKQCWICGTPQSQNKLTIHHSIPEYLEPKKNVLIPVCVECHETMNKTQTMHIAGRVRGLFREMKLLEKQFEDYLYLTKNLKLKLKK